MTQAEVVAAVRSLLRVARVEPLEAGIYGFAFGWLLGWIAGALILGAVAVVTQ